MTGVLSSFRRVVALVAAALALSGAPARADSWRPNEDDALLLELHSGQYKLGDPMRGYQTPEGVCVDFADLIQALDLPVRLDKKSRRATGWLFAEDQRLVIDRDSVSVQTMNEKTAIDPTAIRDTPEGWCIDLRALSGWLGVRLKPDLANLAVVIQSDRKLPFLEAIERKSRAARLRAPSDSQFDLASLPQASSPYRGWRAPSLDVQLRSEWQRGNDPQLRYEGLAAGEVLGLSYAARIAGSGNLAPDSLRLRLYRNDPAGQLLGPLKATQFALGDVETQSSALTSQGAFGRGVFVTNRALNAPSRFGVTTLRGLLPAGWDAELYRNGILRAYQADRGDGRYEFADIELQFGDNDFDVVLYGPQGQVRHERSSVPVGAASLPPGKTAYWAGALQQGRDLIGLSGNPNDPLTGWRWGVGLERGIDQRTSGGIEYQSLRLGSRRRHYLEAALRRSLGPVLLQLSGAQQLGAGQAWRGEALGRVRGINFDAQLLWVRGDFESDLVSAQQKGEWNVRLSGTLGLGSWRLPVEIGARRTTARSGAQVSEVLTRASLHVRRVSLTAELLHRAVSGPAAVISGEDQGDRLSVIANTTLGRVRLRGQARFGLNGNHRGFEQAQVIADAPLGPQGSLRLGLDIDDAARRHEFSAGYVHQFDRFALRGEGRIDTHGQLGFGLTLAFSLGPDPVNGGWRMSSDRLAEGGQASVEVFRDENGDGQRQPDEPAVPGVRIEAGFRHGDKATNGAGRAVVDGLLPYVPVLVSIDTGSLPDPLLRPKGRGMVVIPRPGIAARVALPLTPTGEIEATLLGADGEPRGGIPIELVDPAGRVVLSGASDFDGYLLFDTVPYGDYRLRIAPAAAQTLSVKPELGPVLRIDRAHSSLRLGRLRLDLAPPARGPPLALP